MRRLVLRMVGTLALAGLWAAGCGGDDDTNGTPTGTGTATGTGTGANLCGNNVVDGAEACDGTDLGQATCVSEGLESGDLACSATCTFDLTGCAGCGNGTVETGEQCDPPNGSTCDTACQTVGTTTTCTMADDYDPACATATSGQYCKDDGNGTLICGCDPGYEDTDCTVAGYDVCNPDTSTCMAKPECGDDTNESNDDEGSATTFSTAAAGTGTACAYDDDWFTFTAASNAAQVEVTWTSDGTSDLDFDVTDCAGASLGYAGGTDLSQDSVLVRGLEPGTPYCVNVYAYASPNGGVGDVDYSLAVADFNGCLLDSECETNEVCPYTGPSYGICTTDAAPNAGCGDAVAGDNETSGHAEVLTSGVAINEGTCDGEPDNPPDIDWFTFTITEGQEINLVVDQAGALEPGDVDLELYNSDGDVVAYSTTVKNPESIHGTGLAAGTYYAVVYYYDNADGAASDTYDITVTITDGSGCTSRDDCANFLGGECAATLCVPFVGNEAQEPGDFCDSADDCNPATTGSDVFNVSPCLKPNRDRAGDNVCTKDCTQESDCTGDNMHCFIAGDGGEGLCLAPCLTDADCFSETCTVATGICSLTP